MRQRLLAAAASIAALLALAPNASAQTPLEVKTKEISFDDSGRTRVIVSVTGDVVGTTGIGPANFTLTENGRRIQGVAVEELFTSKITGVTAALVMDVSGSTRGAALDAAKAAAKQFVAGLPPQVRVALISFGATASVRVDFTTDRAALSSGIDSLQAGQRTALYDAVVLASQQLGRQVGAQHNLVVFSDGNDTASRATLNDAVGAIRNATATTTTVLLSTQGVDEAALRSLSRAQRGGTFVRVGQAGGLAAVFGQAAQAIGSQWVLTYPGTDRSSRELDIGVTVLFGSARAFDSSVVANRRPTVDSGPATAEPPKPLVRAFASRTGYYLGVAGAFAAVLLFVGMLIWAPAGRGAERLLSRRLRMYSKSERKKKAEKEARTSGMFGASAIGRKAVALAEKLPRSKEFDEKVQLELDKAGWPLRSTEFFLFQIGGALLGAIIGIGLLQRWWLAIVFAVLGAMAPKAVLTNRVNKRNSAFLEQLPDTLQLLAGSLQAGYGFLQAIDTVSKESNVPTSTEFSRVLTEARLGMPLDEALNMMAERVGGEDFKWVVLAINIQRQVGGNLAQLLTTVAATLREREAVRRQIQVLSAEGRLSAVILTILPFVLAGYLSVVNPGYLSELTKATIGKIMIVGSIVLIAAGALWMRKIIKIEV